PQGMPCFTPAALPDDQLHDIQAYISTFPPSGFLGGPEDVPPPGAGNPRPPGATPPPRGVPGSPCATPTPGATGPGAASPPRSHDLSQQNGAAGETTAIVE